MEKIVELARSTNNFVEKSFSSLSTSAKDIHSSLSKEQPALLYSLYGGAGVLTAYSLYKVASAPRVNSTPHPSDKEPLIPGAYDVAIIGAGPSGTCAAFYMGRAGKKVLLLDRKKFPRDKICGDAITTIAQKHIKEMGIDLHKMVDDKEAWWAQTGGFFSPSGYNFIGNSAKELKRGEEGCCIAIKRIHLDDKLVKAASKYSDLKENTNVEDAKWDPVTGYWTVECTRKESEEGEGEKVTFKARVVIAADGAPSKFARQKGIVDSEPQSVCSRAYITGEHKFGCDGVVFYPRELLPGYCALFRHAANELGYCCYIIPGGPTKNEDLPTMHKKLLDSDPYISKAVGAGTNIQVEPMKAGPLRLGGIDRSFADHLVVIGDAAGFIDPLTGEGIQYAMESGMYAANVILEGLEKGDLSEKQMQKYQKLWYSDWGREFVWSMKMSLFLYRFPIFLDGAAKLIGRRGAKFLADWAEVMTGSQSKIWFLRPDVGPLIVLECLGLAFQKLFGQKQ